MNVERKYIDFEAYERVAEPHKRERVSAWRTAIGLQDVDGLRVSEYLKETAVKHIEGDITIDEVRKQLRSYYVNKTTHDADDAEKEEADRVAANITKLLNEQSFSLTPLEFLNIHRHLFEGIFKHAGEIRPFDISKKDPQKGIQPDKSFLVKFFRNLLLGEENVLKNRYMLIGYKDNEDDTHTTTHTTTHTSSNHIQPSSDNVRRLVLAIGKEEMSVKGMMEAVGLKNRPNFLDYSLTPAINEGFVCMKYSENPHHPRQRYLLTIKGLMLLDGNNR